MGKMNELFVEKMRLKYESAGRDNEVLSEIDDAVKNKVSFIPVKTVDEVLDIALTEGFKPSENKKTAEKC